MKKSPLSGILLLCLIPQLSQSQSIGVDNKGKSVFTHYSKADARFEVSTDEPLSFSYMVNTWTTNYIRKTLTKQNSAAGLTSKEQSKLERETTVSKFTGILLQASMLNSDDYLTLTNLLDMRPGIGFKLGRQTSIGTFANLDKIPSNYWGVYTWGINAIFEMDNIKLYNTDNGQQEKKYPLTYGVELIYSLFFKNANVNRGTRNVLAVNAKLTKTWNDDDLLSYQKIGDVTVLPDVVALEEFEGRYGKLQTDITKLRVAISGPMYHGYLNTIPYIVVNVQSQSTPIYYMGIFTNLLTKPLTKQDFKIPSSLGIGIDTKLQGGRFYRPSIFIKGSISFGAFE